MSEVEFRKHRVFRETEDVIFYDISVDKVGQVIEELHVQLDAVDQSLELQV